MTNLRSSPHSSPAELSAALAFLLLAVAVAAWYFYSSGYLLYFGDAQAHLNSSRSWIDSRTPGYDQIGTVWLPILHLICLPFVRHDAWWSNGLAGTVPVAACFVAAGLCLYLCARELYQSAIAAFVSLSCFVLNPNVLYLATITMTELVFLAGLFACLLAILRFRRTQQGGYLVLAVLASWWMSLTRYDGWFLIPFIALFLALVARSGKFRVLVGVGALASLAPLYWMGHDWFETGHPLDFYNGPYSAAAIQKYQPYPGFHNWIQALHYYWEAGRACCGNGLLLIGIVGFAAAIVRGRWLGAAFLSLTPLFYVWSVHGSWTPIYLPWLWPHGYYNSRYGLAVVALTALTAGAIASQRYRRLSFVIPLIAILPWLIKPTSQEWICWKESERNSISRRAWTSQAANYLAAHYHSGEGVLTEFGDLAGIFGKAHIPLREALHEGNGPIWTINTLPSGMVRQAKWAMAQQGGKLATLLATNASFQIVKEIDVTGAPPLLIYQRRHPGDER